MFPITTFGFGFQRIIPADTNAFASQRVVATKRTDRDKRDDRSYDCISAWEMTFDQRVHTLFLFTNGTIRQIDRLFPSIRSNKINPTSIRPLSSYKDHLLKIGLHPVNRFRHNNKRAETMYPLSLTKFLDFETRVYCQFFGNIVISIRVRGHFRNRNFHRQKKQAEEVTQDKSRLTPSTQDT